MSEGIMYNKDGDTVSFVGEDAVSYYRAVLLASSIGLMAKGIAPTRGMTMKKLLVLATEITGKQYKRTEYAKAREDVMEWARAMRAALPEERRDA